MKGRRTFGLIIAAVLVASAVPLLLWAFADSKPQVQLGVDKVRPHQLEDSTQVSIMRDYALAWRELNTALASNSTSPLSNHFTGFALQQLTQRVKDQQRHGLTTRMVDRGHKLEAIFYARDGSSLELRDTASLETQILDGGTVIHSETAQVQYLAIMTGGADRWYVRVLEGVPVGH
jgi:hypothetical protein